LNEPVSQAAVDRPVTAAPIRPPLARLPVFGAMGAVAVVLTIWSSQYGYHRDELYFRMLKPAWGYVDQPPFTPLLVHLFSLVADEPWAIRIPATATAATSVLIVTLITRELGGARAAQTLCAWGFAFGAIPLLMGHLISTTTIDFTLWFAVILCMIRAELRGDGRWWLAAGLLVGLAMYNKLLIAMLLLAIAAGIAWVGPRRLLSSRWVVGSAILALVVGSPNLVYQATHSWPQFTMGQALADNNAGDVRVQMWPFLLLLLGPPLVPVWAAGIWGLARRPEWRPIRFLAAAFPVLLVLVFLAGTQIYYPFGLLGVLYAAGCVEGTERYLGRLAWRPGRVGVGINTLVSGLIALPLIPVSAVGSTPVLGINPTVGDQVGWPTYVQQIGRAYENLSRAERARAAVVTSNYGEAGALDRYGQAYGIEHVNSGQNELYFETRPPESATTMLFVGGQEPFVRRYFRSCHVVAHLDNGVGVDNEEQGEPVAICRGRSGTWRELWPHFQHYD
jgi:hypothetical protein